MREEVMEEMKNNVTKGDGRDKRNVPGTEKTVLYKRVVKDLKSQIVSGVYRKGELLPSEKELIESFGVSRITIRKALATLADMGFIQTSKGRGSEVLFSVEDSGESDEFGEALEEYKNNFMASTQVRMMLEPEVARQVALTATEDKIEYLKKSMKGVDGKIDTADFHIALVSLLENRALMDVMNMLMELEGEKAPLDILQPDKYEKTEKMLERQHRNILKAIEEGDGEFAYFYMKEHTKYITQIYGEYFELLEK